jgi:hypothetical protein
MLAQPMYRTGMMIDTTLTVVGTMMQGRSWFGGSIK